MHRPEIARAGGSFFYGTVGPSLADWQSTWSTLTFGIVGKKWP